MTIGDTFDVDQQYVHVSYMSLFAVVAITVDFYEPISMQKVMCKMETLSLGLFLNKPSTF